MNFYTFYIFPVTYSTCIEVKTDTRLENNRHIKIYTDIYKQANRRTKFTDEQRNYSGKHDSNTFTSEIILSLQSDGAHNCRFEIQMEIERWLCDQGSPRPVPGIIYLYEQ